MRAWALLALIIASTVAADLLQSHEMKRHGEIQDFRPSGLRRLLATLARKRNLILSVVCMAVSFFAFLPLLQIADLSFAVPASAGSLVVETVLARLILKEHVDSRRWIGAALVAGGVWLLAL
jgi:drug/metabolite transporter (DMT)-like permease